MSNANEAHPIAFLDALSLAIKVAAAAQTDEQVRALMQQLCEGPAQQAEAKKLLQRLRKNLNEMVDRWELACGIRKRRWSDDAHARCSTRRALGDLAFLASIKEAAEEQIASLPPRKQPTKPKPKT
jgi:hypothetical protein